MRIIISTPSASVDGQLRDTGGTDLAALLPLTLQCAITRDFGALHPGRCLRGPGRYTPPAHGSEQIEALFRRAFADPSARRVFTAGTVRGGDSGRIALPFEVATTSAAGSLVLRGIDVLDLAEQGLVARSQSFWSGDDIAADDATATA